MLLEFALALRNGFTRGLTTDPTQKWFPKMCPKRSGRVREGCLPSPASSRTARSCCRWFAYGSARGCCAAIMYGFECRGACCEALCTLLREISRLWKLQEAAVTTVPMLSNLQECHETPSAHVCDAMLKFWIFRAGCNEICAGGMESSEFSGTTISTILL